MYTTSNIPYIGKSRWSIILPMATLEEVSASIQALFWVNILFSVFILASCLALLVLSIRHCVDRSKIRRYHST